MSDGFGKISFPWGFGVDLFFVLSGFVMVLSGSRLFNRDGGVREFLTHRFIRVAPLYWLFTLAIIAAVIIFPDELETTRLGLASAVSSFLFIPWPRWDDALRPLLSLGWTLNYEMFFYALFAATLVFSKKTGLTLLLSALAVLATIGAFNLPLYPTLRFWTDSILLEFGFGVVLGWLYTSRTISAAPKTALALAIFAFFLLTASMSLQDLPRFLAQGIPATLFVFAALLMPAPSEDSAHRLFADWIGESSYSLYLSHPFSFAIVKLVWPFAPGGLTDWLYVTVAVIAATIGGVATFKLIEQPLLHGLRDRRKRDLAPASAA